MPRCTRRRIRQHRGTPRDRSGRAVRCSQRRWIERSGRRKRAGAPSLVRTKSPPRAWRATMAAEAWLVRAAEGMWARIGGPTELPRDVDRLARYGFRVRPILLPGLRLSTVSAWLRDR